MRFLTASDCRVWTEAITKEWDGSEPRLPGEPIRYALPSEAYVYYGLASSVVDWITYRQCSLLWVVSTESWSSSQNWHLYYRLRQSYHDYRLLHEAPGHLFLGHEEEDAISFLQLAMLNGWDFYYLGIADYVHAFVSHDGWLEIRSRDEGTLREISSRANELEMKLAPDRR